jgi:hypothetical protein
LTRLSRISHASFGSSNSKFISPNLPLCIYKHRLEVGWHRLHQAIRSCRIEDYCFVEVYNLSAPVNHRLSVFGWLGRYRRLRKDYELLPECSTVNPF